MKKSLIFSVVIIVLFGLKSNAQQSLSLLGENIYSTNYNIGKPSFYKWHATIPLLSNTNILISENLVTYKDLIIQTDTSKIINPRGLLRNLKRTTSFQFHLNEEILGFGFKIKNNSYLMFSTRLRTESYLFFPNELMKMFIEGNVDYIGKMLNQVPHYHTSYVEVGIGYQYTIDKKYTNWHSS